MAKQMQAKRELDRIASSITEHEGYATSALNQGNEALALEVAEKIASLEVEHQDQKQAYERYQGNAERLKELVKNTERQLADHQRQLSMVKTTESVQKATAAITDNFNNSNSKLLNAKQSLERIKAKQQDFDDRLTASEQLADENSDQSLKNKLAEAGIGDSQTSASSVLDRLKAKQG
jgi:phage shock protein A